MIAELLALAGALLIAISAVGLVRFRDVLHRMHALSKASTLGVLFVVLGGVVGISSTNDRTFVLLVGALQVITAPVAANIINRATYRASGIPHQLDEADDLAEHLRREAERERPAVDEPE